MLKPRYIAAFTGHRAGYEEGAVIAALQEILPLCQRRCEELGARFEVYTSLAAGCDLLFAEQAVAFGIPLHVILPMAKERFREDFADSPEEWGRAERLLEKAANPAAGSVRVAQGPGLRPDCYGDQGSQMLETCDVLIAVWNGEPAKGVGGTASVIAQAEAQGLPTLVIDARTSEFPPAEVIIRNAFQPDSVFQELRELASGDQAADMDPASVQRELDRIAVSEAGRFRPSRIRAVLIHGAAALLGAVAAFTFDKSYDSGIAKAWEHWKWIVILAQLLLVAWALKVTTGLKRRGTHQRWIRCRFACELMRGHRASALVLDPLHPAMRYIERPWARFGLSAALHVRAHEQPVDEEAAVRAYVEKRLSDDHPESQLRHYRKKAPVADRWTQRAEYVTAWCARLAPAFVLFALLNKIMGWELDKRLGSWIFVSFLTIALPLMAATFSGIRNAMDTGRRKNRYPEMAARLLAFRNRLAAQDTMQAKRRTIAQAEALLLEELREWRQTASLTGTK